jgi:hypothetical protein
LAARASRADSCIAAVTRNAQSARGALSSPSESGPHLREAFDNANRAPNPDSDGVLVRRSE